MGGAGTTEAETGEAKDGTETTEAKVEEPVIPEAYELQPPEGFELDADLLTEATPILKEVGLSNEKAQALMPLMPKITEKVLQRQASQFETVKADWAKEAQADPEIGGKNWAETESYVAKALDGLGYPKGSTFRKLLDESGLGNHPEMIRAWRKVGERVSEESTFARSDAGAPVTKSREETWYPSMAASK